MNRTEFMAALRQALSGLPEEERAGALRYYEEYFDDAGPENEQSAVQGLGDPAAVAAQILADYRELTAVPGGPGGAAAPNAAPKRRWRGISPWLLVLLVLLAIPIGLPLAAGLLITVIGILIAVVAVLAAVVIFAACVPLALLLGGGALIVFSFFVWGNPPSAIATLGAGLCALAFGVLSTLLFIKLCVLFVPPIFRGFVAILRWPFNRIRGVKQ